MLKRKQLSLLLISICAIMICMFVTGCKETAPESETSVSRNYDVVLETRVNGPAVSDGLTTIFIADSYNEIADKLSFIYGIEDIDVYDYDSGETTDPTLEYAVEHAFEDKVYAVYLEYRSGTGNQPRIKEVEVTGVMLTMYVQLSGDLAIDEAPSYTLLVAAVDETYAPVIRYCDYMYVCDTDPYPDVK